MNVRGLSLFCGLTAGLCLLSPAFAITGCSNATLTGAFGVQFSGTSALKVAKGVVGVPVPTNAGGTTGSAATAAPVAGIARLTLDGAGGLGGYSAVNLNGTWLQGAVSGSYNVNDDCSFSITMTDSNNQTENFGGIVVGQGNSAVLLQTDAGTGVSGTMKMVRGFCQTGDLAGTYGLQYSGTVLGATPAMVSSVGIFNFDGQGDVAATESRFGAAAQVTSSGTITVNPDCTAQITITPASGTAMNFFGILSQDEKQILMVQSDTGNAVSGMLVQQ